MAANTSANARGSHKDLESSWWSGQRGSDLGALGGTRTPNLLIRSSMCERPAPFRSVRDLGFVSPGCPYGFGASRGCSSAWLPAWLPRPTRAVVLAVVFKSVSGSRPVTAANCLVGTRKWVAKQDHPAHIPRLGRSGWLTAPGMTLFPSGFAGPRLLGGDFVRSGA